MAPHTHPRPGSIPIVRRPRAIRHIEISLRIKRRRVLEMLLIIIRRIGIHVKRRSRGYRDAVPLNGLDARPRQADGDDGPVAQDFFIEGGDVGDFFFVQALCPGVVVGVDFEDFGVRALLDFLAGGRGEVGDAHDEVAGDGVEAGGDHG